MATPILRKPLNFAYYSAPDRREAGSREPIAGRQPRPRLIVHRSSRCHPDTKFANATHEPITLSITYYDYVCSFDHDFDHIVSAVTPRRCHWRG